MKFSIIIPIYNVEQYLRACIDSILHANVSELEIILVNDGSPDRSPQICDEYAAKNDRIKVIHKENGGVSDARNAGIMSASGDYILFVDGDDWIDASVMSVMESIIIESAAKIDVIFLEAVKVYENGFRQPMNDGYIASKINGQDKAAVMNHLAELHKYPGNVWAKLVRRELLLENNIFFQEGLSSAEDIDWMVSLLRIANTFAYLSQPYYYYRQNRPGAATSEPSEKNLADFLYVIEKHSRKEVTDKPYQKQINAFMSFEYIVILLIYGSLPMHIRRNYNERMHKLKWVLRFGRSLKVRLVKSFCSIIGVTGTAWLLKLYRKISEGKIHFNTLENLKTLFAKEEVSKRCK